MDALRVRERVPEGSEKGVDCQISVLLDRHEASVYRIAYLIVRDPDLAAECTQETFVRAYEHLVWGREVKLGWLYTVARHQAINELRRRKRERHADPETLGSIPGIGSTVEVTEALARLSPDDRTILYLRGQGLSAEEIARVLGVRLDAARKRITRARQRFRKLLGDSSG